MPNLCTFDALLMTDMDTSITYVLAGIVEATGVQEIKETHKGLYPYLSMITTKWFATAKDLSTRIQAISLKETFVFQTLSSTL